MGLFWTELYKILRRRSIWFALAFVFLLMGLWCGVTVTETNTVVDGVRYRGLEAIQKDREIARQWEGTLSLERLQEIIDVYGLAVNEGADWETPRSGNWVSRYATDVLTDFLSREDHRTAEYYGEEELAGMKGRLETFAPYFCYMDNMDLFYECNTMLNLFLLLIAALGLAPVFSEEYREKTASVLLTCAGGRGETWRAKLFAALAFSLGLYVLADGLLLAAYVAVYGADGLFAGAALISWVQAPGYMGMAVWQAYLANFLWGLLGVCLLVVTALLLSAGCRQTFLALGGILLFQAGAFLLTMLSRILPIPGLRLLCWILRDYNPVVLMTAVTGSSVLHPWQRLCLLAVGMGASLYGMQKKWNRYEG